MDSGGGTLESNYITTLSTVFNSNPELTITNLSISSRVLMMCPCRSGIETLGDGLMIVPPASSLKSTQAYIPAPQSKNSVSTFQITCKSIFFCLGKFLK